MFSRILKPVAVAVSLTLAASAPAFAQQAPAASKPAPAGASAATGAAVGGVSTGAVVAAIAVVAIAAAASSGSSGAAARLDAGNQTALQGSTSANADLQAAAAAAATAREALLAALDVTTIPDNAEGRAITAAFAELSSASAARAAAFNALSAAFNLPLVGSCAAVTSCTAKEVETLYRNFVIALENEANALASVQRALVAYHDVLRLSSGSTGTLVRAIDDLTSKFEAAKAAAQLAAADYKKWLAGRAGLTEFAFSGVTGTVGTVGTTGTIFGL